MGKVKIGLSKESGERASIPYKHGTLTSMIANTFLKRLPITIDLGMVNVPGMSKMVNVRKGTSKMCNVREGMNKMCNV